MDVMHHLMMNKTNRLLKRYFLIYSLLLFSSIAYSNNAPSDIKNTALPPETHAFNQGNYALAIKLFNDKVKLQPSNAVLLHNIGVCHYKLGHWLAAKKAFHAAFDRNPEYWPTIYNLAVIEKKLGNINQAKKILHLILEQAPSEELTNAAMKQLEVMTNLSSQETTSQANNWAGNIHINHGIDDGSSRFYSINNQDNKKMEQYFNASAEINWYNRNTLSNTWHLNAFIYHYQITESDSLSYDLISFGAGKYRRWNDFLFSVVSNLQYSLLNTDVYLLHADFSAAIKIPVHEHHLFDLKYQYIFIHAIDTAFEDEQGYQQNLTLNYENDYFEPFTWQVSYQIEDDNRQDYFLENTFISYSSTTQELALAGYYNWQQWRYKFSVDYSYSRQQDADLFSDGSLKRQTNTQWVGSNEVLWLLSAHWFLTLSHRYTDTQSNVGTGNNRYHTITTGITGVL